MELRLTRGKVATVDETDADLARLKWCAKKGRRTFYAHRRLGKTTQLLHRVVARRMGICGQVDHQDRNGLNCRRGNLRPASARENSSNRDKQSNNTSGFIGVTWHRRSQQWRAQISHDNRMEHIGYFPGTEGGRMEAARAYNARAVELRGDRAVLNTV
jgi:hypothetical protein